MTEVPKVVQAVAAIDGEHLALALVAASDRPDWVDEIIRDARPEVLSDALRCMTVAVVGAMLAISPD